MPAGMDRWAAVEYTPLLLCWPDFRAHWDSFTRLPMAQSGVLRLLGLMHAKSILPQKVRPPHRFQRTPGGGGAKHQVHTGGSRWLARPAGAGAAEGLEGALLCALLMLPAEPAVLRCCCCSACCAVVSQLSRRSNSTASGLPVCACKRASKAGMAPSSIAAACAAEASRSMELNGALAAATACWRCCRAAHSCRCPPSRQCRVWHSTEQ